MLDLILKGGRIIDPANGRDEIADIGFGDGKVEAVGSDLPLRGSEIIDARGLIVVPGLIDLHTHVYWGGTSLGGDAAELAPRSGTTTFVDAGSAGPGNFHGFRRHVIEPSPLRILPYLNVSFPGIFAFAATVMVGENTDLRLIDPRECVRVIEANRDLIVGVKVRVGRNAGGNSGAAPLDMAIEVADEVGLPVMAHLDHPPPWRCPDPLLPAVSERAGEGRRADPRGGLGGARTRRHFRYWPWRRLLRLPHRRVDARSRVSA